MLIIRDMLKQSETIYKLTKAYAKSKSLACKELLQEEKQSLEDNLDGLSYTDCLRLEDYFKREFNLSMDRFYLLEVITHHFLEIPILSLYLKVYEKYSFYKNQSFTCFSKKETLYFLNNPYFNFYEKSASMREDYETSLFYGYLKEQMKISFDDRYLLDSLNGTVKDYQGAIPYYLLNSLTDSFIESVKAYCQTKNDALKSLLKSLIKKIPEEDRKSLLEDVNSLLNSEEKETFVLLKEELKEYVDETRKSNNITVRASHSPTRVYVSFKNALEYELKFNELKLIGRRILEIYKRLMASKDKKESPSFRDKLYEEMLPLIEKERKIVNSIKDYDNFLYYVESCYYMYEEDSLPPYLFFENNHLEEALLYERISNWREYNMVYLDEIEMPKMGISDIEKIVEGLSKFFLGKIKKEGLIQLLKSYEALNRSDYEEQASLFSYNIRHHFFNKLLQSEYRILSLYYAFTDNFMMEKMILSDFDILNPFEEKEQAILSEEDKRFLIEDEKDYVKEIKIRKPKYRKLLDFYLECCFDYLGLKKNTLERKYGTIKKHKKEDKDE